MNGAMQGATFTQAASVDWRQRLYRVTNSQAFVAFLFLLVPVLLLAALKIWPVFYNLYLSFTRYELFEAPRFVGMKNYNYVFSNSTTRQSIINTLLFTIEAVPVGTALALTIAKLLDQKIRGRVFLRTLYYLPVVSSVVVSAMIWRWIYSRTARSAQSSAGYGRHSGAELVERPESGADQSGDRDHLGQHRQQHGDISWRACKTSLAISSKLRASMARTRCRISSSSRCR